jgi:hypothetical protein
VAKPNVRKERMAGPDTPMVGKTCPGQRFSVRWNKEEHQLEFP